MPVRPREGRRSEPVRVLGVIECREPGVYFLRTCKQLEHLLVLHINSAEH